ncbi:MAG: hypothetical protein JNL25_17305 [Rhodospirillaceae bacterium]|nr:hypothetical protein [Rhodospirillaceae bacterium]
MAIMFLATASIGTVENAYALCADAMGMQGGHEDGHQHDDTAGTEKIHQAISKAQEEPGFDGEAGDLITVCHGSTGCPGCVLTSGTFLSSVRTETIAFRHTAVEGSSTDPDGCLRPPKYS